MCISKILQTSRYAHYISTSDNEESLYEVYVFYLMKKGNCTSFSTVQKLFPSKFAFYWSLLTFLNLNVTYQNEPNNVITCIMKQEAQTKLMPCPIGIA